MQKKEQYNRHQEKAVGSMKKAGNLSPPDRAIDDYGDTAKCQKNDTGQCWKNFKPVKYFE